MLWILSWKNIWRNKLRSSIVMMAVTVGVFCGVFMIAFMNGMVDDRINTVIQTEISHIQIHQPDFRDNYDFSLRMHNADSLLAIISKVSNVKMASKRIVISSVAATAATSSGVKIIGVEVGRESKVTNIGSKVIEGSYLGEEGKNAVVIGQKLANKLKVGIHKKVIITLQDVNKNIVSGAFRVIGIYKTSNDLYDEATIFVRYSDLCRLTGINPTEAHELAILLNDNKNTLSSLIALKHRFPTLEVQDWMEISPEAGYLVSAMDQYMFIFILIILFALCFSIVNTMLMVVLERVKELGMLMAVGMSQSRIFFMIVLETVFLSLTGGVIGICLSYLFCQHWGRVGIDLYFWKDAYASIGYSSLVYPTIDSTTLLSTTVMVIITGILSALYPAYKALKLNPAEATRSE